MKYNVKDLNGSQVLKLFMNGIELICPHHGCGAILESIPKDLSKGTTPFVIRCPIDDKHFYIHYEPIDTVSKMRKVMIKIAKSSQK